MMEHQTNRRTNGESRSNPINRAKRRLLALDAEQAAAFEIARRVDENAHFAAASSRFVLIGEIVILLLTGGEIYYLAVRDAPLGLNGFFSLLMSIWIAGFLTRRLCGLRRLRADEKKLLMLDAKIAAETAAAEKLIAESESC